MVLDLTFILIFVASFIALWYRVSIKIPELVAIPDEVITARLEENSARLRLFLLQFKTFYREGRQTILFWQVLAKTLYRLHIFILRIDNGLNSALKKIRERGIYLNGNGGGGAARPPGENRSRGAAEDKRIQEIKVNK